MRDETAVSDRAAERDDVERDSFELLLEDTRRIADGVGEIRNLVVALVLQLDPPARAEMPAADRSIVRTAQLELDAARHRGAEYVPVPTRDMARLLDLVARERRPS